MGESDAAIGFFVGIIAGIFITAIIISCMILPYANSQQINTKICDTNITITHTDYGVMLPYYIVYSKTHSYRVDSNNKWIYQQSNANIGEQLQIKYKSYYDNQGNEIREIINMKSNWNNNCNDKKLCDDKED